MPLSAGNQRLHFALMAVIATLAVGLLTPGSADSAAVLQSTPVSAGADGSAVQVTGLVGRESSFTVGDLQELPSETVTVTYVSGGGAEEHTFTGVRLIDVLGHAELIFGPDERNPLLTRYVIVHAKDGFRIVLSGGELAPAFGNTPILLAWEQDGQPLTGEEAPFRLVVPGDTRGGRYVHGVVQIDVLSINDQHPA